MYIKHSIPDPVPARRPPARQAQRPAEDFFFFQNRARLIYIMAGQGDGEKKCAPSSARCMSRAASYAEVMAYDYRNPHKNKTFTTAVQGWLGNPRIECTN